MAIVINGSGTVTGISVGGLPDGIVDDGTLATDSVTAAKLKDDAIATGDLPAGSVIQVVSMNTSQGTTSTTSAWQDTDITLAITPSASSSKVLIIVNVSGIQKTGNNYLGLNLLIGSTSLTVFETQAAYNTTTNENSVGSSSIHLLNSPSTISATTYKVQIRSGSDGSDVKINYGGDSSMTLMEIAA